MQNSSQCVLIIDKRSDLCTPLNFIEDAKMFTNLREIQRPSNKFLLAFQHKLLAVLSNLLLNHGRTQDKEEFN